MNNRSENQTILVIEDDFGIQDSIKLILESEGYKVSLANNGKEAMDQLKSTSLPCLILLDLMMPIMDGWTFRSEQIKDPVLSKIPVIIMSADGQIQQKTDSVNATAFLKKPIHLDILLKTIKTYCY